MIIIHHRDITDIDEGYRPDCIVNASNPELTCGGGVSGAIHRACDGYADDGEKGHYATFTLEERGGVDMIGTGSAVLCGGGLLTNWVIQTVAPRMYDGDRVGPIGWEELLRQCYWNCLQLAQSANLRGLASIAFPMLGTGAYGLPWVEADEIAFDTCRQFAGFETGLDTIHLVIGPHSEDGEERYELLARRAKELRGVSVTT